jgi:hypothetical protein
MITLILLDKHGLRHARLCLNKKYAPAKGVPLISECSGLVSDSWSWGYYTGSTNSKDINCIMCLCSRWSNGVMV